MNNKQSKKEIFWEIFRFLVVGGTATLFDYVVSWLFQFKLLASLDPAISQAIALTLGFTTGLLINWFLQKFVFKYLQNEQMKSKVVFIKFVLLSLFGLGLTLLVMDVVSLPMQKRWYVLGLDMGWFIMKCVMTCVVLVINYLGRKFIVFKKKKNQSTD